MMEDVFEELIQHLNCDEAKNIKNGFFDMSNFYELENVKLYKKSVKIKIKEERKKVIDNFIKAITLKYNLEIELISENKYFYIQKIRETDNFIILEYAVNSHVQVPKCILKEFSSKEQNNKLNYISLDTHTIKSESPKKFNTVYGYYSKMFEDYLNINYESKIGVIKTKLKKFINQEENKVDLTEFVKDIKEIFMIQVYRNPNFVSEFNDESISSKLVNGYSTEDIVSFHNMFKYSNMLDKKMVTVVINETLEGLVTTRSTLSSIIIDDNNEMIIMPLSPKFAIALVEKKYFYEKNIKGNIFRYMKINDTKELRELNKWIFCQSKRYKNESVIGLKGDLTLLLDYYKTKII